MIRFSMGKKQQGNEDTSNLKAWAAMEMFVGQVLDRDFMLSSWNGWLGFWPELQ